MRPRQLFNPDRHRLRLGWPACLLLLSGSALAADRTDNPTTDMLPDNIDWAQAPVVVVSMGDNYFEPEELTLKLNHPYRLILNNISDVATHNISSLPLFHSLVLKQVTIAGVTINTPHLHNLTLRPNSQTKLFLMPLNQGEMEFHCNIPGHAEAGMEGLINIVPASPRAR